MLHIDFEHVLDSELDTYREHFACTVRFRRHENAIIFPAHFLEETIQGFDRTLNTCTETVLADMMRSNQSRLDLFSGLEAWMTACLARAVLVSSAARAKITS